MSASEFEGHEALVAQLRAGTLDAPGHLHRRTLAGETVKRRRWADMSGRRRMLLVVPVAATLAVGAAVVDGAFFAGSGSNPVAAYAPAGKQDASINRQRQILLSRLHAAKHEISLLQSAQAKATLSADYRQANGSTLAASTAALRTQKTLAFSMEQSLAKLAGGNPQGFTANHAFSDAVSIPSHRLVHADASLEVGVASHAALTRATNDAQQIVAKLGGYTQSNYYKALGASSGNAYLKLRVPVGAANLAIRRLGHLGRLLTDQVATRDLQRRVSRQTNKVGTLQRTIAIYQQALNSGSVVGEQRIEVQIRLANAEHELTATRKARSGTVAYAATADISLRLTQQSHQAVIVTPAPRGRLSRLLHNAVRFLGLEGIIVLYALIVAAPIALLVALMWWLSRERRRRDERLLAANA